MSTQNALFEFESFRSSSSSSSSSSRSIDFKIKKKKDYINKMKVLIACIHSLKYEHTVNEISSFIPHNITCIEFAHMRVHVCVCIYKLCVSYPVQDIP